MSAALHDPTDITVGFDLGGTVAVLKAGTMREHTLRVYREFGHIHPDVPDEKILSAIADARRIFEGALEAHRNRDAFWRAINAHTLNSLTLDGNRKQFVWSYAGEIHESFFAPSAYTVRTSILETIRGLRSMGVRVAVASNATHNEALAILEHLDIAHHFDAICTSDTLGARKQDRRFWEKVVEATHPNLSHRRHARMRNMQFGNSLYSDGYAAHYGWIVGIIDTESRYAPHSQNVRLNAQFSETHTSWLREAIRTNQIQFARSKAGLDRLAHRALNLCHER